MRLVVLFTCILVYCLWGQVGDADIYVWVDENGVKHFTNENPPPQAELLMRTKEISYDEAADRARHEAERQQELLDAQAKILELEAQLAEQQAEVQQRIAEADRKAAEALQRAENLLDSINDRYDSNSKYSYSYGYYPKRFNLRHYRYSKYYNPARGGIYYHKQHKRSKGHYRFKRHRSGKRHHVRKHFKAPQFHHGRSHKKFSAGRHHLGKHRLKSGRFSRFRNHTVRARTRFYGHQSAGVGRH